jgi:hypothetical protein
MAKQFLYALRYRVVSLPIRAVGEKIIVHFPQRCIPETIAAHLQGTEFA